MSLPLAGTFFLRDERARNRQRRDNQPVTGEKHADAKRGVVEWIVRSQTGKCAAVVVGCRRKGIEHFAETMRATGVLDRCQDQPDATTAMAVPTFANRIGISSMSDAIFIS